MSTKQRLDEAIAALPDSLTVEEAVERLYRAFKLKQAWNRAEAGPASDPLAALIGLIRDPIDVDACLSEARGPAFDPALDGDEG